MENFREYYANFIEESKVEVYTQFESHWTIVVTVFHVDFLIGQKMFRNNKYHKCLGKWVNISTLQNSLWNFQVFTLTNLCQVLGTILKFCAYFPLGEGEER